MDIEIKGSGLWVSNTSHLFFNIFMIRKYTDYNPIVINYNLQDGGGRLVLQRQAAENLRGSWEKWERTVEAGGRASDDAKARGRGEEEAEQGEGGGVDQDPDGAGDSKVGEIWAAE